MIAVDASVLIGALDCRDALHRRSTRLLQECADQPLAASVITVAEVLVAPIRAGRAHQARAALREMEVEGVPLDDASSVTLAELCALTSLKLPDCCVLHAAQSVDATRVLTLDARLAAAARDLGLAA